MTPEAEAQVQQVLQRILSGARKAIAAGFAAGAVIKALRLAADYLEGKHGAE